MLDTIQQQQILEIVLSSYGYIGLFIFGTIASTIIPLSPEVAALFVWKIGMPVIPTTIVLILGNYAGNVINYWIGYSGIKWAIEKFFSPEKKSMQVATKLFEKYGPPVLIFSWLPIIGDPMTFVPGILRYSFKKFTFYTILGKTLGYIALYYLFAWWL
jgi:membrane protein YqaA with SNARE-associated domain